MTMSIVLMIVLLAVVIAGSVIIAELVSRLRALARQAVTDPLTGAYNRRHLTTSLERAVERRARFGESACLLLFDVDRFKDINDRLGHTTGDAVLKALVVLAGRRARSLDTIFRTGGEEFALLLPGTILRGALTVAEQLRAVVAAARLVDGLSLSISVGVSELREGQSPREWIEDADRALYHAKNAGRNRVAARSPATATIQIAGTATSESTAVRYRSSNRANLGSERNRSAVGSKRSA